MNVRWTVGDEFLVSVGGNDRCAFFWKHTTEEHCGNRDMEPDLESADILEHTATPASPLAMPTGGDESGAVKPWLGNVRRPTNPPQVRAVAQV